jgi:vacuolar-type H+-ATPase subunit I/STV1
MDSSRLAITELQTRATGGQGEAQSDAARAVADLRQREMELRSDLAAYRSASADRLDAARDRLATSYEAYAKAIANAETSMKSPQSASPTMPRQN